MSTQGMHTPGPWSIVPQNEAGVCRPWLESCPSGTTGVQSDGTAYALGVMVAAIPESGCASADAALIAAAPEMLEALQTGDGDTFAGSLEGIANFLATIDSHPSVSAREIAWLRSKASQIRAAIAKATPK